jgi:hypothetical protein
MICGIAARRVGVRSDARPRLSLDEVLAADIDRAGSPIVFLPALIGAA